jgi:HNH endonuclease
VTREPTSHIVFSGGVGSQSQTGGGGGDRTRVRATSPQFGSTTPTLNPTGLCRCGCGEPTPIAAVTSRKRGWRKGEPILYRRGHSARVTNSTRLHTSKITVTQTPSGCLLWDGAVNSKGYPTKGTGDGRTTMLVHRAEYERANGPLPAGFHLHHLCETPRCINPSHLIALTQGDHNRLHAWQRRRA